MIFGCAINIAYIRISSAHLTKILFKKYHDISILLTYINGKLNSK